MGGGSVSHPGSQQALGSGTGPGEVARGQPWAEPPAKEPSRCVRVSIALQCPGSECVFGLGVFSVISIRLFS